MKKEELMEAVSEGVRRAFWAMITNATQMPTADFFDSIENGVRKAMEKIEAARETQE